MGEVRVVRVEGVVLRVNQWASMQWIEFNTCQPDYCTAGVEVNSAVQQIQCEVSCIHIYIHVSNY